MKVDFALQKNTELVSSTAKNKVTIITAVAKKPRLDPIVKKGELMESNMDAMEVDFFHLKIS